MRIRLIDHRKESLRKVLAYVYIALVGVGIGLMTRGRIGGGESFYSKWNAPLWLYVVTIIIVIVITLLALVNAFSGYSKAGSLIIDEKQIILERGFNSKRTVLPSANSIRVIPNYVKGRIDRTRKCKIIELETDSGILKFDIAVTDQEHNDLTTIFSK